MNLLGKIQIFTYLLSLFYETFKDPNEADLILLVNFYPDLGKEFHVKIG